MLNNEKNLIHFVKQASDYLDILTTIIMAFNSNIVYTTFGEI
jgi:hypothetical protein